VKPLIADSRQLLARTSVAVIDRVHRQFNPDQ
jgi:hypothetical protein